MGQVKKAYMALTMDDMGDNTSISGSDVSVGIGDLEEAHMEYEVSKMPSKLLMAELDKRGWKVLSK